MKCAGIKQDKKRWDRLLKYLLYPRLELEGEGTEHSGAGTRPPQRPAVRFHRKRRHAEQDLLSFFV